LLRRTPYLYLLTLLLLSIGLHSHGLNYTGEGYGKTAEIARQNALIELSQNLYVEVQSEVSSIARSDGSLQGESRSHIRSNLPILGAKISITKGADGFRSEAQLDAKLVRPIYLAELKRLKSLIKSADQELNNVQNSAFQLDSLNRILTENDQFQKLNAVSILLGNQEVIPHPVNILKIKNTIQNYSTQIPTLSALAKIIATQFNQYSLADITILPVRSKSPTQLSRVLKGQIKEKWSSKGQKPANLHITYEEINDSLNFYTSISQPESLRTIKSYNFSLIKSGYKHLGYQPKTLDFQSLLHDGLVIQNTFQSYLNTDLGDNALEVSIGDTMRVFVKLSKAGYYYVINYSANGKAYLLELSDAIGNRKFVQYVSADDANKWISLGEFEIAPPLGTESLHLISSTQDLAQHLPTVYFNPDLELWESKVDPKTTINQVRTTANIQSFAEDTLTFTSLP